MVTLIFTFDLRSGQVQVEKVKFLKSKISFSLESFLSIFVLGFQKCHFYVVRQLQIQKIEFQKMTSLPLSGLWANTEPKIKILASNFVHLLLVHSSITPIPLFWIFSEFLSLLTFIFEKK